MFLCFLCQQQPLTGPAVVGNGRYVFWIDPVEESKVLELSGPWVRQRRLGVGCYLSNGYEKCPGDPSSAQAGFWSKCLVCLNISPSPRAGGGVGAGHMPRCSWGQI